MHNCVSWWVGNLVASSLPHQTCFAGAISLRYLNVEAPGELRSCEKKCRKWGCKPSSGNADMEGTHRPPSLTLETSLVPEFLTIYASAITHCAPRFNACERTGRLLFLMGFSVLPGSSLDNFLASQSSALGLRLLHLCPLHLTHSNWPSALQQAPLAREQMTGWQKHGACCRELGPRSWWGRAWTETGLRWYLWYGVLLITNPLHLVYPTHSGFRQ